MRHPRDAAAGRGPDFLSAPAGSPDSPAAAITTYIVKAGEVDAFKRWADRLDGSAAQALGFLDTMRLEQSGGVLHLVQRFATAEQRDAWRATAAFRTLAAEADRYSHGREQLGAGRDLRFSLPGEADATKWKKFLMTLAAVFPVLLVLNLLGGLTGLPQLARLAITSPMLTALLTWVILPKVTRWLKTWVLTDADGRPRKPGE
jgi:antibiotic biosynthesis monooxygenase (ABM) superfamily enzyme